MARHRIPPPSHGASSLDIATARERLLDPANATRYRWAGMPLPGIAHEGQVIWGLTLRTLQSFVGALGYRLPQG